MDVLDLRHEPSHMKFNTWYSLKFQGEVPTAQVGHTATVLQKHGTHVPDVIIVGGATPERLYDQVWILDLKRLNCKLIKASGSYTGRYEHCSFMPFKRDKHIWIFAGANMSENKNELWDLDYHEMTWRMLEQNGDIPSPRTFHVTECHDSLTVFGGGLKGYDPVPDTNVYQLNTRTRVWSLLSTTGDVPSPRHGHIFVSVNGEFYCHGGMAGRDVLDDLYILNKHHEWKKITPSKPWPCARCAHATVSAHEYIFIFGGLGKDEVLDDLWRLNTASLIWNKIEVTGNSPYPRLDMVMMFVYMPRKFLKNDDHESGETVPCILVHGGMNDCGHIFDDFNIIRVRI